MRRHRRGVDREHVVYVVGIEREHGDNDLDLVTQTLDESRAQRAVDQPAGQDSVLARASFATEERSGDAAGGVHLLFDVNRQREEVEEVAGLLLRGGRGQDHRVVIEVSDGGAGGLPGKTTGLEADGAGAEGAVVDRRDCFADGGLVDRGGVRQNMSSFLCRRVRLTQTRDREVRQPVFDRSQRIGAWTSVRCVPLATTEGQCASRSRHLRRTRDVVPQRRLAGADSIVTGADALRVKQGVIRVSDHSLKATSGAGRVSPATRGRRRGR